VNNERAAKYPLFVDKTRIDHRSISQTKRRFPTPKLNTIASEEAAVASDGSGGGWCVMDDIIGQAGVQIWHQAMH
jgi:hypothetical protein